MTVPNHLVLAQRFVPHTMHTAVVAVDPGPGFGVATFTPHPAYTGMNFDTFTYDFGKDGHSHVAAILREHHEQMRWSLRQSLCEQCDSDVDLVCEKFEYRKDDAERRDRIDFTAAEYVGVCKATGWAVYENVVMQGAAEAKGFWSDDKLRQLGLYAPGQRHANDALRHLLKYMAFTRNQRWLLEMLK